MVEIMKRGARGRIPRPETWQRALELCLAGSIRGIDYPTDERFTVNGKREAHGDRAEAFAGDHPDEALECLTLTVADLAREGDTDGAAHWQILADNLCTWLETPFTECDPWDEPEARKGRKKHQPKARTEPELKRFFRAINRDSDSGKRFYAIATLTRNTGARIGEVLNLTLRDLDLEHGAMWIAESKNHKQRSAVIAHLDETRKALDAWFVVRERWGVDSEYVFVTRPGDNPRTRKTDERVNYRSVAHTFETVSKRAGLVPPVMPHQLRHTFISRAIENGAAPAALCKQSGHANPNVLLSQYTHVIDKAQLDAVRCFEGA